MEQPKVEDLIRILEEKGKDSHLIITILANIIRQQMMYGGVVEDKINYEIDRALKNG